LYRQANDEINQQTLHKLTKTDSGSPFQRNQKIIG